MAEQKPPELGTGQLARYIDHTLLKLDATTEQIDQLCDEAKEYNFKSVCVRLRHVAQAVERLRGSDVIVACVVGFHQGSSPTTQKLNEGLVAVHTGASELDIVLNYAIFLTNPTNLAMSIIGGELRQLRHGIKPPVVLKLILETSQLGPDQIVSVCKLAKSEGFDFVKTSTGFNGPGATIENVQLMRYAVGPDMGVKASGGVKTLEDCLDMIAVGASRIGTSSGVAIMKEEMRAINGAARAGDEVKIQDGSY